jgi:methylation protein EvaC
MAKCLVCQSAIEPFLSFGKMPIANRFLRADEFEDERFFELQVAFCAECAMVQLTSFVDREEMFHESYAFYSSTSRRMTSHFAELAADVTARYLTSPDPFVVEIGSNDGILLRHFAGSCRHLGIEPSANVAKVAMERGIHTLSRFFDEELAREIAAEHGQADVFLGANVMCHIPYIHSVAAGIRTLLKPTGVLVFEDPYLGDILEKTSYDQIYDEHALYFSVSSVSRLFEEYGMEVVDAVPQNVHGGSMRYVVAHRGAHRVSDAVAQRRSREREIGLHLPQTYDRFRENVERSREALVARLREIRRGGDRIVGYGATSKSTTVTNYCGITPDLVEFISDTTPIKQGKFSPGTHIPVKPYQAFSERYPDVALLFAWNHGDEILEQERAFRERGGRFLLYVPQVAEV